MLFDCNAFCLPIAGVCNAAIMSIKIQHQPLCNPYAGLYFEHSNTLKWYFIWLHVIIHSNYEMSSNDMLGGHLLSKFSLVRGLINEFVDNAFGSPIMLVTYFVSLGSWMTTCMGKSCSFGLLRVPFVNYCQFMYIVISLLVLRAWYGIWLYQFLIIAYLFTFHCCNSPSMVIMFANKIVWLICYKPVNHLSTSLETF